MATGVGDLVSHLEADNSDFVAGMEEAADEVENVTLVIHEQRASWSALAQSALPAIGEITSATLGLIGTLATIRHQKEIIGGIGGAFAAAGATVGRHVGLIARAVGFLVPQWKAVTTAVAVAAIAWKAATSDVVPAIDKKAYALETVRGATSRLGAELERLGSVAASPIRGAASAMADWWNSTNLLKDAVNATTKFIASELANLGDSIGVLTDSTQEFLDIGATALYAYQTDATDAQAQAFYEEAQALRDLNVETRKAIAAAEARLEVTRAIGAIQDTAKDAAAAAAEVDRIRAITTLEGIEAQRAALQQLAREQTIAGKSGEAYLKQQAALFTALEQQAEAIRAGKVQPEGMKEAESALKALDAEIAKLTGTYEELAEARRRDGGATDAILGEIRQREELKKTIEAQKEAEKLAAKQLEDDTRRQNEAWENENEKIAALKDQLDLLTGAATKADIERRKAIEAGFTDAGAEEIAALTAELDAAQAKERQKSEKSMREQSFEFATKGSSAAFSALFKAENRGGSAEERTAKAAEKTAQEIGKTNDALGKLIVATEQNGLVGMEIGGDS